MDDEAIESAFTNQTSQLSSSKLDRGNKRLNLLSILGKVQILKTFLNNLGKVILKYSFSISPIMRSDLHQSEKNDAWCCERRWF